MYIYIYVLRCIMYYVCMYYVYLTFLKFEHCVYHESLAVTC